MAAGAGGEKKTLKGEYYMEYYTVSMIKPIHVGV